MSADLLDWQVQLGSLVMGAGTPYGLKTLTGLDELPDIRPMDYPRAASHGDFSGLDTASGRTIGMEFDVTATPDVTFADAKTALRSVMVPSGRSTVPFWFKLPDRPLLTASVKVRRHRLTTDLSYAFGLASAAMELRAPDPLLYGPTISQSTGFPAQVAGLGFPLFTDRTVRTGMLDYGARSTSGRLILTNEGTAEVWPVFEVAGPVPVEGFDIVRTDTGDRIRFVGAVPVGSSLVIDSASGTAVIDGDADRGGSLTYRQWFSVPREGSIEVAFVPLGTLSAATLTASCAPGWW
jgi:hypothetical protein